MSDGKLIYKAALRTVAMYQAAGCRVKALRMTDEQLRAVLRYCYNQPVTRPLPAYTNIVGYPVVVTRSAGCGRW